MICNEFRCVFVHIPKTAGQSVEQFFVRKLNLDWEKRDALLLRRRRPGESGPERLAHLTLMEYVSGGYIEQADLDACFKFAFVRNPWSRLVSEYRFRYQGSKSFRRFVLYELPERDMSDAYRHVMPQFEFVYDSSGDLRVDFLGRFEKLQADFDEVCSRLELTDSLLPHANTSRSASSWRRRLGVLSGRSDSARKDYVDYYDSETRERVEKLYCKDVELFGYKFDQ